MFSRSLKGCADTLGVRIEIDAPIRKFAIDSRMVEGGDLFFAIKGNQVDGHQFLEQVAKKGAIGAVVSRGYAGSDFGLTLLRVDDVKDALQALAKEAFRGRKERVIAITGSMGKTTTKEFLATLLEARFRVAKTPGNQNTQLTLPLMLLNLEGDYDLLVLEMGMSQKGHIAKLVDIAPPDYAMITRIAPAGMEGFRGGLKAISEAKAEIFSSPKTTLGLVSVQAAQFPAVMEGCPKKIYGWKEDFYDARLGDFVMEEGLYIEDSPRLEVPFEGRHLKENFLGAAAMGRILGLSWHEIQEKAKSLKPFEKRFEKIEREGVTFIQDCYNANPDSVMAAIDNLPRPQEGGKVVGVLGKMPDLGDHSEHYHRAVGERATKAFDTFFSIGEEAKWMSAQRHYGQLADLKRDLFACIKPGDVVLIKGANSLKLWELLER